MSIIAMASSKDVFAAIDKGTAFEKYSGAYSMVGHKQADGSWYTGGGHGTVIYTYAEGCVLKTWEKNGYNDSDFMASYWDEAEQKIESVCFATTRAWTYPCYGSFADATDEVKAKVDAFKKCLKAEYEESDRKEKTAFALEAGFETSKIFKLAAICNVTQWHLLSELLVSKTRAGSFRDSLKTQVIEWMDGKTDKTHPLSAKQMNALDGGFQGRNNRYNQHHKALAKSYLGSPTAWRTA